MQLVIELKQVGSVGQPTMNSIADIPCPMKVKTVPTVL